MAKSVGKALLVLVAAAAAAVAMAQPCACVRRVNETCQVLQPTGPDSCRSLALVCDRCECVEEGGEGTETCDVLTVPAPVFVGNGSECETRLVTYAECPADIAAGWVLGANTGNVEDCNAICNEAKGACNAARTAELNDLGGVDNAAFAAAFAQVGIACELFTDASASYAQPIAPAYFEFLGRPNCLYDPAKSPTCGANLAAVGARRMCCCGQDSDCPL
uniref:Uncharacterized protein n=1 Tax=Erythrolobus australicus TaxID=1077150 RepID=A0A7S1XJ58_9RHOD|mmetsp:Transcript_4061/g.11165  ORF Transcript_4061/g.11165 Transcript_4061/m.11165 type:complete len:219 (+) Transcript_4061:123-779(+)